MGSVKKHFKYGCKMEGAILLSNQAIKQECIVKNLYWLPSHMTSLAEKIKTGMLLFLFVHEERKLYGVFEATSDGVMSIVPDAFHFSGKSLSAQVPFRRVWMCRPLCEDEFCHAIVDNYHFPKKFDFCLSYDQVFKLVQLFYLRRINIEHNLNHVSNKIIRMFEKDCDKTGKSSRRFVKTLNRHLTDYELQLQLKASLNASINRFVSACSTYDQHHPSRCEILPLSEDPVSYADSSNAAIVSFKRYDQTHPIGTSIQESMHGEIINSSYSHGICPDTKKDNLDANASKSILYDELEETNPFIKSKLHPDIVVKRTSVFSRLSIDPKTALKRKSFSGGDNLIMMAESSKQSKDLERITRRRSTSMLITQKGVIDASVFNNDSIAEIRPNFMKIREIDDGTLCCQKKLELLSKEERNKPKNVGPCDESYNTSECLKNSLPSECSQDRVCADVINNDPIAEVRPSFKKIREMGDGTLYDHKKLVLLSTEERIISEDGSKHVESEMKAVSHNKLDNISCLKNRLSSECNQSKVDTDDTEKSYGIHKKKITSKNLLWFLQKTKDLVTTSRN